MENITLTQEQLACLRSMFRDVINDEANEMVNPQYLDVSQINSKEGQKCKLRFDTLMALGLIPKRDKFEDYFAND
jgi:hypothetical protein